MSAPSAEIKGGVLQAGVNLGSTWGQPGVNLGSTWGQPGVNMGSTWGQPWVNLHRPAKRRHRGVLPGVGHKLGADG
jgi:hypothetical protein